MSHYVRKIKLISQTVTYGQRKERIVTDGTPREIFAEIQSVTRAEFFQAQQAGMSVDGKAIVWAFEYKGEQILVLDTQRFAIYRTYQVPGSKKMELYYMSEVGPATPAPGGST